MNVLHAVNEVTVQKHTTQRVIVAYHSEKGPPAVPVLPQVRSIFSLTSQAQTHYYADLAM